MKNRIAAFLLAAVLLTAAVSIHAQTTVPPGPVAAPAPAEPAPEAPKEQGMSFKNLELQTVVETLAEQAQIRLIIPEPLTGKVYVRLTGVDPIEALRRVLESKNYVLVEGAEGVYTVQPKAAEALEILTHTLNYTSAAEIIGPIKSALTSRGKLDTIGSTLIIYDVTSNLPKVVQLIKQLDTRTPQILIETRLYEMVRSPKKELGVDWSKSLGGTGLDLNLGPGTGTEAWLLKIGNRGLDPTNLNTAVLTSEAFGAVIKFLNSDTDTELIATPRLVTADNREAVIQIVQQEPIPNFQFNTRTAAFEISGFEYKDIGNILKVTPRVNKDGFITLDVAPEISNLATFREFSGTPSEEGDSTTTAGGGSGLIARIPVINKRNLATRVLLKNGDTLAIGGLMQTEKTNVYTKVPLLGDLPVVGMAFRSRSLATQKRNLLIFITPTEIAAGAKTGFEDQAEGLRQNEIYTDDVWMPRDNAKPVHWPKDGSNRQ